MCSRTYAHVCVCMNPLTEEIRFKIFGSRDLSVFLIDLLSDGDSVYTRENLYENVRTPMKSHVHDLFCSRNYFKSNLLRLWKCVYT